ncbi:hypothetical protein GIB67_008720 [Kingdonia uniflora]|uniref:Uncharacterized protein n=1 Tax=Kingdonia uniflora TaxID=39325 RepID=A0A7J7NH51_9MAGN|nr:hypothetical protein GIB67_008720 [Kingdonia uniflora]
MARSKAISGFSWADEVEKEEEETHHHHHQKRNPFDSARPREVGIDWRRIDQILHQPSKIRSASKESEHKENIPARAEQSFSPRNRGLNQSKENRMNRVPSVSDRFENEDPYPFVPPIMYPPKNLASLLEGLHRSKKPYIPKVDLLRPRDLHNKRESENTTSELKLQPPPNSKRFGVNREERHDDCYEPRCEREKDNFYNENRERNFIAEKLTRRPIISHELEHQRYLNSKRSDGIQDFRGNEHFDDFHDLHFRHERENMTRETGVRNFSANELVNRPARGPSRPARGSSNNEDREWDHVNPRYGRRNVSEERPVRPPTMMNGRSGGFINHDKGRRPAVDEVDWESMEDKYGGRGMVRNGLMPIEVSRGNYRKGEIPPVFKEREGPNRDYDHGQRRFDMNPMNGATGDRDRAQVHHNMHNKDMRRSAGFDYNKRKRPESNNNDFHQRKRR